MGLFAPLLLVATSAAAGLLGHDEAEETEVVEETLPAADGDAAEDEAEGEDWDVLVTHGPGRDVEMTLTEGTWMSVDAHGGTLVFDLLGDIWTLPAAGGAATRLTDDAAWDSEPRWSPDGRTLAFASDRDGNEQIWLMDADGSDLRKLTDESEARVTDPVWDTDGQRLIVRRRTVDTRSIGVTELWQVDLEGGKGQRLTSLDEHPHAGETTVAGRHLYFSSRHGRFNYDENPVGGLWRIERLDRWTGETRAVAYGGGSAVRPTLSPDGGQLAFVSRDRDTTVLELLDLETGRRHVVADWLDHDHMEGFALHGTYPVMDWLDPEHLVLWAKGGLWKVALDGSRIQIPFKATGSWHFQDVPRWSRAIPEEVAAKVVRWPAEHPDGTVVFSAMGALWEQAPGAAAARIGEGTGYAPAWSPDGRELVWTSWDDAHGGALHLRKGRKLSELPVNGMLVNPAWSPEGDSLVVLRGVGGSTEVHPGNNPWFELVRLDRERRSWTATVLRELDATGANNRAPRLRWHDGRIWYSRPKHVEGRQPSDTELVSVDAADGTDLRVHVVFDGATEVVLSPDFRRVAFKQDHQVHLMALPPWSNGLSASDGSMPSKELTEVVGDWLHWSPDGSELGWMVGPELKRLAVPTLATSEDEGDEGDEGDAAEASSRLLDARLPRHVPQGSLALTGATVLPITGPAIEAATVLIEGDRITAVGADVAVPAGATVVDVAGKYVIPGLIDVHGHMHYSAGDVLPEQEWRYQTNLDFGVTTVHDPSASTDLVFTQAERVEAGLMKGPRITSTGFVLYGALANQGAKTPDAEAADAHIQRLATVGAVSAKIYQQSRRDQRQWYVQACNAHEILCVAEGGGDLWMNLTMVADGFHAIEHALPIAPLYADVQQWMAASPGAETAGTAYTPTLLVAYGGLAGENYFFQEHHPYEADADDPDSVHGRLLRHYPRRLLDRRLWRVGMQVQDSDWNHQQVARDAKPMQEAGVLVTLGAHGQLQGLGVHWELWSLAGPGAMSPEQALQAATLDGARYLGMDDVLGSIDAGKLADLVVLDADPRADIHNSTAIHLVLKNGEIVVD